MEKETCKFLKQKRREVLNAIKSIMEAFGITDYDYVVNEEGCQRETLIIEGQKIGCSANSVSATINEVIGYLFVEIYAKDRWIGRYKTQTLKAIKEYWIN